MKDLERMIMNFVKSPLPLLIVLFSILSIIPILVFGIVASILAIINYYNQSKLKKINSISFSNEQIDEYEVIISNLSTKIIELEEQLKPKNKANIINEKELPVLKIKGNAFSDLQTEDLILNYHNFIYYKKEEGGPWDSLENTEFSVLDNKLQDINYIKSIINDLYNYLKKIDLKKYGIENLPKNFNYTDTHFLNSDGKEFMNLSFSPLTPTGERKKIPFVIEKIFLEDDNKLLSRIDLFLNRMKKLEKARIVFYLNYINKNDNLSLDSHNVSIIISVSRKNDGLIIKKIEEHNMNTGEIKILEKE